VIAGRPSLRTPEGWRELEPGEVVAFPLGERGAHQASNFSEEPARYLFVSEIDRPGADRVPRLGEDRGARGRAGTAGFGAARAAPLGGRGRLLGGREAARGGSLS